MRRVAKFLLVMVICLLLGLVGVLAMRPRDAIADARPAFAKALESLAQMQEAGPFDDQAVQAVEAFKKLQSDGFMTALSQKKVKTDQEKQLLDRLQKAFSLAEQFSGMTAGEKELAMNQIKEAIKTSEEQLRGSIPESVLAPYLIALLAIPAAVGLGLGYGIFGFMMYIKECFQKLS